MKPNETIHFPDIKFMKFQQCGIYLHHNSNWNKNKISKFCRDLKNINNRILTNSFNRESHVQKFYINGSLIEKVPYFKYIGRIDNHTDDDWNYIIKKIN